MFSEYGVFFKGRVFREKFISGRKRMNTISHTHRFRIARGALANTVTGGFVIAGGFLESGGPQTGGAESDSASLDTAILLGSLIDGTADQIVLCARPINSSTNVDIEAGLTWREIV